MKKFIISGLAVLFSTLAVGAHNNLSLFNIGGRVGIISSSEVIPTTGEGITDAIKADGTGWTGTVFARINVPILPLFIQPELQYTNTTIDLPSIDDFIGEKVEVENHTYIDLPILIGAEIGLGSLASVRVNAGPVFAITSEKGFGDLVKDDFIAAYKDPVVSWTAGLGVKVLSFIAEVRYNGNFNGGEINFDDIEGSINTNRTSWNLSIGVVF